MDCIREKKNIHINLTNEEALVFFDWLAQFNENNDWLFQHRAEEQMLFEFEAILEKCIAEVFSDDYKTKLLLAREKLANSI